MTKTSRKSVPFEDWKAEKKRSLERMRVLKLQKALRDAMRRSLNQPPDMSPPRPTRGS